MELFTKSVEEKPLLRVYVSEGTGITVNKKIYCFPTAAYSTSNTTNVYENATNDCKVACLWRWFNWTSRSCTEWH
jgi:hypothetical protein